MLLLLASIVLSPPGLTVWDLNPLKASVDAKRSWDELQAAAALQGLANRDRARLYVSFVGADAAVDRYWLRRLRSTWLKHSAISEIHTVGEAIARFRKVIKGVVVWDPSVPATSNVASTIAGVEDLLPIRYDLSTGSLYRQLVLDKNGPRLLVRKRLLLDSGRSMFTGKGTIPGTTTPSTGSAKCDAYLWAAINYLKPGRCNAGWMGYYPDAAWLTNSHGVPLERTLLTNHDFFIAKRAFLFDLSPWEDESPDDDLAQPPGTDAATLKKILAMEFKLSHGKFTHVGGFTPWDQKYTDFTGRKHGGVETEWHYAEVLTCFNAFMDADAPGLHAMANASVFMHEPLQPPYRQPNLPTVEGLAKRGYLAPDGSVCNKSFVSIYVGDYDSAAWLYTMIPQVWDDSKRGVIPLGWAFNPVLDARFPTGLVYTRETASKNDTFISGDSGAGYLNPGFLTGDRKWSGLPSGLAEWEAFSKAEFAKWDLRIVGFIIDGNAPPMDGKTLSAYSRIAPDGVVAQKVPKLSMTEGTPFLRMGSDLPNNSLDEAAKIICRDAPIGEQGFSIFRTILWTPSQHAMLFQKVKVLRPDIEFVEPYTLMMLAKLAMEHRRP